MLKKIWIWILTSREQSCCKEWDNTPEEWFTGFPLGFMDAYRQYCPCCGRRILQEWEKK